jgi:hypothetical protein
LFASSDLRRSTWSTKSNSLGTNCGGIWVLQMRILNKKCVTALIIPETSSASDSFIEFLSYILLRNPESEILPYRCWRYLYLTRMHNAHERPECENLSDEQTLKNSPLPCAQTMLRAASTITVPDNTEAASELRRSSDQSMDSMTIWTVAGVSDTSDISRENRRKRDYCLLENVRHLLLCVSKWKGEAMRPRSVHPRSYSVLRWRTKPFELAEF